MYFLNLANGENYAQRYTLKSRADLMSGAAWFLPGMFYSADWFLTGAVEKPLFQDTLQFLMQAFSPEIFSYDLPGRINEIVLRNGTHIVKLGHFVFPAFQV